MLPLLLSIFIFGFFALLGRAVMIVLGGPAPLLRGWLVAPAIGLAVVTLAVMVLNQAGLPVRNFALGLLFVGLGFSAAIFVWRRPLLPGRALAPFATVLLFSLLYAGWPALVSGFDWVAQANDDMANYCLGAQRFLQNGFFRMPTEAELGGLDYSQYYWFMHVVSLVRFGSEILLAWVAGWTGCTTLQVFMPLTLALGLGQVSATAALVLATTRRRSLAVGAAALLALSPLFLLGTYYQLIAQVGGLALLLAFCALAFDRRPPATGAGRVRRGLILGLLAAALGVFYPEVTPFVALGYGLFVALEMIRERRVNWARFFIPLVIVAVVLVLLRYNLLSCIVTLLHQTTGSMGATAALSRFPYYLLPSGPATGFGLLPLAGSMPEPWNRIMIVAGGLLLLLLAGKALRDSWRGEAQGSVLLIMLLLGLGLFLKRSDFGLFKIAMFTQPLVACSLAGVFFARGSKAGLVGAGLLCLAQLPVAHAYALGSLGRASDRVLELPGISQLHIGPPGGPAQAPLVTDTHNPVAAKLAALQAIGRPLYFLSFNYFTQLLRDLHLHFEAPPGLMLRFYPDAAALLRNAKLLSDQQTRRWQPASLFGTRFQSASDPALADAQFLGTHLRLDVLNQRDALPGAPGIFFYAQPFRPMANHLTFISSSRGHHYYEMQDPLITSFYQVEKDYFRPGRFFSALGGFMLLRVDNPAEAVYLKVSLTKSVMGRGRTELDMPARVLGGETVAAPLAGAGAACVFVGPVHPVRLNGASYIALDFGERGRTIDRPRAGVMALYNQDVEFDWRRVVAYGRDISCLSAEAYGQLARPRVLGDFPRDLLQAGGVEFSGWFEDGWISPASYVVLGPSRPGEQVKLRGSVPGVGSLPASGQELTVRINGGAPLKFQFLPGEFNLDIPVTHPGPVTRINLAFTHAVNLPSPDDRPVSAKIAFLGLTAN